MNLICHLWAMLSAGFLCRGAKLSASKFILLTMRVLAIEYVFYRKTVSGYSVISVAGT